MLENKRKKYRILSIVFGGIAFAALLALIIALAVAKWNVFAIKPGWLGFTLLIVGSIALMVTCLFVYGVLTLNGEIASTVLCPDCGALCSYTDTFCASCGGKLKKIEKTE